MTGKLKSSMKGFIRPGMPRAFLAISLLAIAGCGGGGGDGGSSVPTGGSAGGWTPNVFLPAATFAAQCARPRSGTSDRQGSVTSENNWLRSWTNDLYLWYSEVTDRDPASQSTTDAYFQLMRTTALTATGAAKDKFHFTYPTDVWLALSQSGVSAGYGFEIEAFSTRPPRQYMVAYLDPGYTPNVTRGLQIMSVDGVDLVNDGTSAGVAILSAGLFPATVGETHSFGLRDNATGILFNRSFTSVNVTSTPVQNVKTIATPTGTVGYMQFNDHIATAEAQLIAAINTLKAAAVTDLVLDIRYNGGGYLDIASELAYMIAGPALTGGRTFEQLQFNSKYPSTDPVTGRPIVPTPFYTTSSARVALPTLNLSRVYVVTGPGTCSASESIINGLRGVNVDVIQIGSTTCGKPYGFYPQDNCSTTYFSIEFRGINDKGFGDYTDGYSPSNTSGAAGVRIAGCSVADDFTHALGDPAEGRLAAALNYRTSASCGPPTGLVKPQMVQEGQASEGMPGKSPSRDNRMLRDRQ